MGLMDGVAWERDHGWEQQPRPIVNNHPAVWDLVLNDLEKLEFPHPTQMLVKAMLVVDIKKRDAAGERKYGTRLQPFNGRNSLQDAYEEALDCMVYMRQACEEIRNPLVLTPYIQNKQIGLFKTYQKSIELALQLRLFLKIEKEQETDNEFSTGTGNDSGPQESSGHQSNIVVP